MSGRKLPSTAYKLKEGERFVPLTAGQDLPEFTFKAVLSGILLGVVFGAANTYLGLMSGLTISTSIPVAVLTVVVFRLLAKAGSSGSLLETNISQTVGSAGGKEEAAEDSEDEETVDGKTLESWEDWLRRTAHAWEGHIREGAVTGWVS